MKRNWYAIVACLVALFVWQIFVAGPQNRKLQEAKLLEQKTKEAANPISAGAESKSLETATQSAAPTETPKVNKDQEQSPGLELVVLKPESFSNTQLIKLGPQRTIRLFENGSLARVEFLDYKVRDGDSSQHVATFQNGIHWRSSSKSISDCLYNMTRSQGSEEAPIFTNKTAQGECTLRYSFVADKPGLLKASLLLKGFNDSAQAAVELGSLDYLGDSKIPDEHNSLYARVDGSLKKLRDKELVESSIHQGQIEWMSWGDKYFTGVVLPQGKLNPNIRHQKSSTGENWVQFAAQYPYIGNDQNPMNLELDLYFGTKDPDDLIKIHPTLDQAVELGFAASVAKLMLWLLKIINKGLEAIGIANFGLAIILLTALVRVVFWPLNKKVFVSGQRMKQLQPKIQALREKFGNDRSQAQAMNVEMMGLYKKHNVNPLGSCLPMLLQMPIFIGLYGALSHSLDLYQAPFFGWIHDLSSKDPFYVFPILWTLSLLVYIKLNPMPQQPGQPDMKWIMVAMNVVFGYFSKDWPAGLTLYLFVSNLVGILQQIHFLREVKHLKPLEEGA